MLRNNDFMSEYCSEHYKGLESLVYKVLKKLKKIICYVICPLNSTAGECWSDSRVERKWRHLGAVLLYVHVELREQTCYLQACTRIHPGSFPNTRQKVPEFSFSEGGEQLHYTSLFLAENGSVFALRLLKKGRGSGEKLNYLVSFWRIDFCYGPLPRRHSEAIPIDSARDEPQWRGQDR